MSNPCPYCQFHTHRSSTTTTTGRIVAQSETIGPAIEDNTVDALRERDIAYRLTAINDRDNQQADRLAPVAKAMHQNRQQELRIRALQSELEHARRVAGLAVDYLLYNGALLDLEEAVRDYDRYRTGTTHPAEAGEQAFEAGR